MVFPSFLIHRMLSSSVLPCWEITLFSPICMRYLLMLWMKYEVKYHVYLSSCSYLMIRNKLSGCMWRVWYMHFVWSLNLMMILIKWRKCDLLNDFMNRFFHIYSDYLPFMRLRIRVWFSFQCIASLLRGDMIYLNKPSISSFPSFRINSFILLVCFSLIIFVVIVVIPL